MSCTLLQPLQVGSYYLFNGGTKDECPYTSCSNANLGQRYLPGFAVRKDNCSKEACPEAPAPPGFYFERAGYCNLTQCTSGKRGTYYTQGCAVDTCTNGNARSQPATHSHTHTHTHTHTACNYVILGGIEWSIRTLLGKHLARCWLRACNTRHCAAPMTYLDQKIAPNPSHRSP